MDEGDAREFTARLRALFASVRNPVTGQLYTCASATREINAQVAHLPPEEQAGRSISNTYLWQLFRGNRSNPTLRHLQSLAALFGASVGYLAGEDEASPTVRLPSSTVEVPVAITFRRPPAASVSWVAQLHIDVDVIRHLWRAIQSDDASRPAGEPDTT